jgi:hypothetical protein
MIMGKLRGDAIITFYANDKNRDMMNVIPTQPHRRAVVVYKNIGFMEIKL